MAFYDGERFPRWRGNLFIGALRGQMLVRLELDGETVPRGERLLRSWPDSNPCHPSRCRAGRLGDRWSDPRRS
jgi:glucose/arabinose dehydrogenase